MGNAGRLSEVGLLTHAWRTSLRSEGSAAVFDRWDHPDVSVTEAVVVVQVSVALRPQKP